MGANGRQPRRARHEPKKPDPPWALASPAVERALLGSLFLVPDCAVQALGVTHSDFFVRKHRYIFRAIELVQADGKPIDLILVRDILEEKGALKDAGGDDYLLLLAESVPTGCHLEYYAQAVRRKAERRRAIELLTQLIQEIGNDVADAMEIARKLIDERPL